MLVFIVAASTVELYSTCACVENCLVLRFDFHLDGKVVKGLVLFLNQMLDLIKAIFLGLNLVHFLGKIKLKFSPITLHTKVASLLVYCIATE